MTEEEWETSVEPLPMLDFLQGSIASRKLRLLACASSRRIWRIISDPRSQEAVAVAERLAEGLVTEEDRDRALLAACDAFQEADRDTPYDEPVADMTSVLLCPDTPDDQKPFPFDVRKVVELAADMAGSEWSYSSGDDLEGAEYDKGNAAEKIAQCRLIRDIAGSPFHPVALATPHRTPTVVSLARAAYDERQLPSGELDPLRLSVLADALEEAGAHGDLITHLRSPGLHVRGCWAVDLLLGKE